jgi:ribose-phosphate pyrophosphokinase
MRITHYSDQYSGPNDLTLFVFSGGEVHVKLASDIPSGGAVRIQHRIQSSDDVMRLLLAVDALNGLGVQSDQIDLMIPYFPYARQDRRMVRGEPHSLKVFSQLVNSLGVACVRTVDPHSDVVEALVNNLLVSPHNDAIKAFAATCGEYVLISPDAGAYKKVSKLGQRLNRDVIVATKERNTTDGTLTGTKILGDVAGKNCLIVDDICDGGATFVALGRALKDAGAAEVSLFVTHGIFRNGSEELLVVLDRIGTTNTFLPAVPVPNVTVFPLSFLD